MNVLFDKNSFRIHDNTKIKQIVKPCEKCGEEMICGIWKRVCFKCKLKRLKERNEKLTVDKKKIKLSQNDKIKMRFQP
jgi:hypothetical protein